MGTIILHTILRTIITTGGVLITIRIGHFFIRTFISILVTAVIATMAVTMVIEVFVAIMVAAADVECLLL